MPESVVSESRRSATLPAEIVQALFDTLDGGVLISERAGRIVMGNVHARQLLELAPSANIGSLNLFSHLLHVDPKSFSDSSKAASEKLTCKWNPQTDPCALGSSGCLNRIGLSFNCRREAKKATIPSNSTRYRGYFKNER